MGGRPGGEPRAARSERGEQRRRAPGGALSDPDWRHPEQRRTDLVGAEEPPAYARFRLTAEDFGHRNGPPLIPRMQGKRKDLADLWSRGTGDGRRPALGPHGIAHAHPFGRVHAARQERRRGLRHGLRRFAGGPEAPHVSPRSTGGRTAVAAADPHWARRLHRNPGAPAFPPEARPWAGASTLAQPQPLSVLSSPGPAARRRPAAVHSTALPLPPGPGPPLAVPLPVSRSRRDRVHVRLAAREHRGPGVPAHIPECHGPPWTLQMMTRVDSALIVLQAMRAPEVMPSMSSIRSVVVCVATPASLVRGRLCWRSSASPRSFRL